MGNLALSAERTTGRTLFAPLGFFLIGTGRSVSTHFVLLKNKNGSQRFLSASQLSAKS